jgi:hypothetical protein
MATSVDEDVAERVQKRRDRNIPEAQIRDFMRAHLVSVKLVTPGMKAPHCRYFKGYYSYVVLCFTMFLSFFLFSFFHRRD